MKLNNPDEKLENISSSRVARRSDDGIASKICRIDSIYNK